MGDLPSDIPARIGTTLRARLLRIHSKKLEGAPLDTCLREVYDVFATALRDDGEELTNNVLCERIPAQAFHWAVVKQWLPYPPLQHSGRSPVYFLNDPRPRQPRFVPVPDHKLNVQFGEYRITDWCKADILKRLSSRIAFWQAEALEALEALERSSAQPPSIQASKGRAETTADQINRLRAECRWTIEDLAEKTGLGLRSVQRHIAGSTPYDRNITAYERAFSKQLKKQIVIHKMA